jgi:hypothetical protein
MAALVLTADTAHDTEDVGELVLAADTAEDELELTAGVDSSSMSASSPLSDSASEAPSIHQISG